MKDALGLYSDRSTFQGTRAALSAVCSLRVVLPSGHMRIYVGPCWAARLVLVHLWHSMPSTTAAKQRPGRNGRHATQHTDRHVTSMSGKCYADIIFAFVLIALT